MQDGTNILAVVRFMCVVDVSAEIRERLPRVEVVNVQSYVAECTFIL